LTAVNAERLVRRAPAGGSSTKARPTQILGARDVEPLVPVKRDGVFRDTPIDLRPDLFPKEQAIPRERDREFESPSLHQRVIYRR
jgi:hypothetical protein